VALMPAFAAPNKRVDHDDPGPEHRLAMCRLAVIETPGIAASGREIERGGVSYTVDTLQAIHTEHPDVELTFIVGADTACTLGGWREPQRLLSLAALAVAERDGLGREEVREALLGLHPSPRIEFLAMAPVAVSSSQVRQRAARGLDVDQLVGERVAAYIAEHGLYRDPLAVMPERDLASSRRRAATVAARSATSDRGAGISDDDVLQRGDGLR
jgi:nicotinate-nucleotide adenylyltransferase